MMFNASFGIPFPSTGGFAQTRLMELHDIRWQFARQALMGSCGHPCSYTFWRTAVLRKQKWSKRWRDCVYSIMVPCASKVWLLTTAR